MKIRLSIPPTGTNHGFHTGNGRWYKDQRIKDWEEECLWELKKYKPYMFEAAFYTVTIDQYFADNRKNDIDGRIKFILDVLQKAGFYEDDCFVKELHITKAVDKVNPRIEVEIS